MINANIKNKTELATRLIAGETFYHKGDAIFYDETYCIPFRIENATMVATWNKYSEFTIKSNWYQNIPEEGIICWVSDINPDEHDQVSIIREYRDKAREPFVTYKDNTYQFTTSVAPEDIYDKKK